MRFSIPAKTFLLGEYAALSGAPALLLASEPSFAIERIEVPELRGIHPESPAGKFWSDQSDGAYGLQFFDPYDGIGGLGASSAQFLGAYQIAFGAADIAIEHLLSQYYQYAWNGLGQRPSGYDILAQMHRGLVFVHRDHDKIQELGWPFDDVSVYLIHTGKKLATHTYLQQKDTHADDSYLGILSEHAFDALQQGNATAFLHAVRMAGEYLDRHKLVAPHSQKLIAALSEQEWVRAVKGCGAMGADILSVYIASGDEAALHDFCHRQALQCMSPSI